MLKAPSGIESACDAAGNQTRLAEALGVSQQAVSRWRRQGWVPLARAREIETLTGVHRASIMNPRVLASFAD
jgi:DNA-binding transcriptional regulator YdaS (Cro superfamily)